MAGGNRSWGYASYDTDGHLIYTSYEKDGSVNKYRDNGDGGHSHEYWKNQDDYNLGRDADYCRTESNGSKNPEIGEVESNGGCYLTTACMKHYMEEFDDNCYYLDILRWFRDNYVSKEDKKEYYEVAPKVVETLDARSDADNIYQEIYYKVIQVCVRLIEYGKYNEAYEIYKNNVLELQERFVNNNSKKLVLN